MTEIMVHSLLDSSFSFTGSKFNHIPSSSGPDVSTVQNSELEQGVRKQMNTTHGESLESSACEADAEDTVLSDAHVCDVNVVKRSDSSVNNALPKECNISSEDYKILATKTTVINTTYNLIAQSTTTKEIMNMTTGMEHSSCLSLPNVMTETVDKSRVVVQVLKSDLKSKSQNVVENKSSNPEIQSNHSFRDDLCKLLSKSPSSPFNAEKSKGFFSDSDTVQDVSSDSHESNKYIGRALPKPNFEKYFLHGKGAKIGDLKCVCDNLRQARPFALRYLHYCMFNSYGLCGSGVELIKTKRNINSFCGYPFERSSKQFQKKFKSVKKIPEAILVCIYRAVFGKAAIIDRSVMVHQLIDFLWFPRRCSEILKKYGDKIKHTSEEEYDDLKESALRGPILSVVLEKLPENYMRRYTNNDVNEKYEVPACQSIDKHETTEIRRESSHTVPAFILNGPGKKLKSFPKISYNVKTIHEKPIKMLHYILYGRIEPSIKDCRRNILEFNGFSDCQKEFASEREDIIKKLNQRELFELCQVLCLRGKTNSREIRIKKIFEYLQSPSKPAIKKFLERSQGTVPESSTKGHLKACMSNRSAYRNICRKNKYPSVFKSPKLNFGVSKSSLKSPSSLDFSDEIFASDGWKLRDFKTICSNVECAAPSDLIELNDLLFLKTCDESDIHQKILDFTGFNFPINSFHYDSRKTLMHYMGFCILRKIARLLDIENWDSISNPEDLSSTVLKFLMSKVEADSPCSKSSSLLYSKSATENSALVDSSPPSSLKSVFESSSVAGPSSPSSVLENSLVINPEIPKSLESEFYQHSNQAVSHQTKKVIIQRLTKASVQTQEMCQSKESDYNNSFQINEADIFKPNLLPFNSAEDDSISLRDLIHHPSEQELKDIIIHLVKENLWCFTLGDLVQKVYECYPKVNLSYRESFIKVTVRQMLSELRDYAVSTVKDHIL